MSNTKNAVSIRSKISSPVFMGTLSAYIFGMIIAGLMLTVGTFSLGYFLIVAGGGIGVAIIANLLSSHLVGRLTK